MLAKDIMTKDVIVAHKEDTVETVIQVLKDNDISGLPVVDDDGILVGIVSEGDLIYKSKKLHFPIYFSILDSYIFLEKPDILKEQMMKMAAYKVKSLMTEDVIYVEENQDVEEIATTMTQEKINRVPVVDKEKKVMGIVTRRDIIGSYQK